MRSLLAIAVVLAFVGSAAAGDKVDWSQYIEKPGDAPPKHKSTEPPAPKEKAPAKTAAKPKPKAPAASAKAKPRKK